MLNSCEKFALRNLQEERNKVGVAPHGYECASDTVLL